MAGQCLIEDISEHSAVAFGMQSWQKKGIVYYDLSREMMQDHNLNYKPT